MSLGSRLLLGLSTLALVVASPTPAVRAAEPVATQVSLDAPPAYAGNETTLLVTLAADTGEPVGGAQVTLDRRTGGAWEVVATLTTDAEGRASQRLPLERDPRDNVVRVRYDGDTEHAPADRQARLELKRRASTVVVRGPAQVEDGRSVPVKVRWTTRSGAPVRGAVQVVRALGRGPWQKVRTVRTDDGGRAELRTTPRQDSRWRARGVRQAWVEGDRSPVHRVDNVAPGVPAYFIASVSRNTRSAGSCARSRTSCGSTWMPSQISPSARFGSASSASVSDSTCSPILPGSGWRITLYMWVTASIPQLT